MERVRYEIPEFRLESFADVVLATSKKARKLGVEGFSVERIAEHERTLVSLNDGEILTRQIVTVEEGEELRREWERITERFDGPTRMRKTFSPVKVIEVEVSGAEPVLAGWRFVASIDHDSERNLVSQVPGPENPVRVSEWIEAPPNCDHCKLFRYRLRTYVLENVESGELRQVGSTCIEDYLGGQTAAQIARLAELWVAIDLTAGSDRDEDWAPGQRGEAGWLRSDVLAQAAAIIRRIGFTSKKAAEAHPGLVSTATLTVSAGLNWRPSRQEPEAPFPVEQEDADLAAKVTEWVEGLEPRPEQDYLWNLQTAVGRPLTTLRTIGLVVSAISAYDRELAYQARKEVERLEARPVPVTNGRVTVEGKVLTTKLVETDYGVTEKMLVQVAIDGGAYKVWGTVPRAIDPEVGDTVRFDAKVDRSRDDAAFGFFSRPTKASVTARKEDEAA